MCVVHLFYIRGLMSCMFFAFAHAAHTCVPFKLWVTFPKLHFGVKQLRIGKSIGVLQSFM